MNNNFFSKSYKESRKKFLDEVNKHNLKLESYKNSNLGIDQEELSIDVCFINPNQEKIFLITSGCHGIEGYAGSALQLFILKNLEKIQPYLKDRSITLMLVHALNPWGFSWGRRVTEEGVDLNRNFLNWDEPLPQNEKYDLLHDCFVPWVWPYEYADKQLHNFISIYGNKAMQDLMTLGQYNHPTGLFYGGKEDTWSATQIKKILNSIVYANDLLWIDIHTGLGTPGDAEILCGWEDDILEEKSKLIFYNLKVNNIGSDKSATSKMYGGMQQSFIKNFKNKNYIGILYEIGTVSPLMTARALRAEQTIWNNEAQKELHWFHSTRPFLRSAMYPEKTIWFDQVCAKWENVFFTALKNF